MNQSVGSNQIVVTGVAGIFPNSKNVEELFKNLDEKRQLLSPIDIDWKIFLQNSTISVGRQPLAGEFDAGYFGISFKHAEEMHPGCRKLLELSVEAVMDSGTNPLDLKGSRTGVFVTSNEIESKNEWVMRKLSAPNFSVFGVSNSMLAALISYYFQLQGPSVTVDTFCASSFSALELAFKSILSGRCDSALVCGLNTIQNPNVVFGYQHLGALNLTENHNVFDESCNGYTRSEASAVIFIQKLQDAKESMLKYILNSKSNHDGFKNMGILHPSSDTIADAFQDAYAEVGIDPATVFFVESHITGTKVGIIEEVQAIEEVFCSHRKTPLPIGCIKANIGHCEPVSGLASLIKILVGFHHNCVLPSPDYKIIKPYVNAFQTGKIIVPTERIPLPNDQDIIIGCNSFGIGGSNCHVVVKHHHKTHCNSIKLYSNRLVCFSARSMSTLNRISNSISSNSSEEFLTLLDNVFKQSNSNHWYRGYVVIENGNVTKKSLKYCDEKVQLGLFYPETVERRLSFLEFITNTQITLKTLIKIQRIFFANKIDVLELWNQKDALTFKENILANVAFQIIVTDFMQELVRNRVSVFDGTSIGSIVAAYAKGILSLEDVLLLAVKLGTRLSVIENFDALQSDQKSSIITKELNCIFEGIKCVNLNLQFNRNTIRLVVGSGNDPDICFQSNTTFEEVLGRLYIAGIDLNLEKLYPNKIFPVKAQFISPLIQWKHEHEWPVFKYNLKDLRCLTVTVNLSNEDWKFLSGHVIDGSNLFPASAYLVIAWNCYLKLNHLVQDDTKIIFENIRFLRATILSNQKPLVLTFAFTKIQDKFEVCFDLQNKYNFKVHFQVREGDECLVSGFIRKSVSLKSNRIGFSKKTSKKVLINKDIYKKLNLHGYNYKNDFCCLQEASLDGSNGLIEWNNWTTFLDAMEQLTLLSKELDDLHIPLSVEQVIIDPQEHARATTKYGGLLPIHFDKNCNLVSVPGVEIKNLLMTNITKRAGKHPVLETYQFVPFNSKLPLEDSVAVIVQLVTENLGQVLKVAEIVDSLSDDNVQLLCPIIDKVPNLQKSLSVFSLTSHIDVDIVVVPKNIDQLPSDVNLVILSQGSSRLDVSYFTLFLIKIRKWFQKITEILKTRNCFVLSREVGDFKFLNHLNVVAINQTDSECLVLLQNYCNVVRRVVELNADLSWLKQLQSAINANEKVLLVDQNNPTSGIIGLINCLKQELGQHVSCMFLPNSVKKFDDDDDKFFQQQLQKNLLVNVLKDGEWGSYRHLPLRPVSKNCFHAICATSSNDLSQIQYVEGPITKESDTVEVCYAGVNFKDLVVGTGKVKFNYLKEYRSKFFKLGFEFAGTDSRGQRVMGVMPCGAFTNIVSTEEAIVCRVPDDWSLEDAATVPVTYITVLHSLLKVIELKCVRSVLVHSGTGGIGLSAINVCLHFNFNIFVTVGSETKRSYLKKLYPTIPDSHIGNSRDNTFEQMILKQTGGQGVDVVINSLTEDKLRASVRCLASKGVLVELGKYDSHLNHNLPFSTIAEGRVYTGVHLDLLQLKDPIKLKQLVRLLEIGIKDGYVKPLPRTVYDKLQVNDVLHTMSLGMHTGKILLKIKTDSISMPIQATPRFFCDSEKVYVIVGGLGGFGLELSDWLIGRGAQKLILVSRTGPTSGYQNFKLRNWKKIGCKVLVSKDDLITEKGCNDLLKKANSIGTVDGIFNLSVVLHDALIDNQTEESFNVTLSSKALITQNLDTFSRDLCPNLRQFVVFSSYVSGRGNSGQTNYGMANSASERICEQRQVEGYPALAIQWGMIGDVGILAEKLSIQNIDGMMSQGISSCLDVMDTFLTQNKVIVSSTMYERKKTNRISKSDDFLTNVAEILAIPNVKHVSMYSTLSALGMDSASSIQLKHYLESERNMYFTPRELRNMVRDDAVKFYTNLIKSEIEGCLQKYSLSMNDFLATYDTLVVPETEEFCSFLNCVQQDINVIDSHGNINASALYYKEITYLTHDMIDECVKEARTGTRTCKISYLLFKCLLKMITVD
ncbi:hypothetical protein FQR65_LT04692 [Abscondita terminalis]|nr:hypothetical protein FQR65_LT04692 [Abscondita terminalis]